MKNLILLIAVCLTITSCNQNRAKTTPGIVDSIVMVDGMGAVVKDVYEGTIPAADTPGQTLKLTLFKQEYAPGGVYELSRTYKEARDGKDETFVSNGKWGTLVGGERNVFECVKKQIYTFFIFRYLR